jgi:penicillin-binding protein 1C
MKRWMRRDFRDNWTVGYTTRYTVAVWIGNFDARPMAHVSGVTGAGRLFRDVMLLLHEHHPPAAFPTVPGLTRVEICPDSGELPGPDCPQHVTEAFLADHTPQRSCPVHQRIQGRLVAVWPARYDAWLHDVGRSVAAVAGATRSSGIMNPPDGSRSTSG